MHGLAVLFIGLVGLAGETEYARTLGVKALDQAASTPRATARRTR